MVHYRRCGPEPKGPVPTSCSLLPHAPEAAHWGLSPEEGGTSAAGSVQTGGVADPPARPTQGSRPGLSEAR